MLSLAPHGGCFFLFAFVSISLMLIDTLVLLMSKSDIIKDNHDTPMHCVMHQEVVVGQI